MYSPLNVRDGYSDKENCNFVILITFPCVDTPTFVVIYSLSITGYFKDGNFNGTATVVFRDNQVNTNVINNQGIDHAPTFYRAR